MGYVSQAITQLTENDLTCVDSHRMRPSEPQHWDMSSECFGLNYPSENRILLLAGSYVIPEHFFIKA